LAQPFYRDASKTLLAKGVCLSTAGQVDEATRTLTFAYERDPGNPALAVNLAEILSRRGQHERAAFYIRRVNQQPAWVSPQTLYLGARIERGLGRVDATAQLLKQLRQNFPQSPEALAADRGAFDD
jgi:type IV pilus assembly protein PilF